MRINKLSAGFWTAFAWSVGFSSQLMASMSEGLPWESPLEAIANSLTGPVAKAAGVIAIAVTGLSLAMGEAGGFFRRLLQVVFGLSLAFAAASWGIGFLGFGSGSML